MLKKIKKKEIVAVLLTTCNSEKFLETQIESILCQKHVTVHIYISDDNSFDGTLTILEKYFLKYPKNFKKLYKVNFKNSNKNFINLIKIVPSNYKYYALCDHDDYWLKNKLSRAVSILNKGYSAYGCRLKVVDKNLNFLGFYSELLTRPLSFKNALVQGIVGNATLVFNNNICKIFKKNKINFVTDTAWLVYLITTYLGYNFFYDKKSMIKYRQHAGNVHSISSSLYSRLKRIFTKIITKADKISNDNHINLLQKIKNNRCKENILVLNKFDFMRKNLFFIYFSLNYFKKLGIYRQTKIGNIRLITSLIFKLQ